jgi:hypothetical protein
VLQRFRPNEVQLWLSVIAYSLGNLWGRLVLPDRIEDWWLTSLQQRMVKTCGRLIKHALLLDSAGREPFDTAALRKHRAEDDGATRTSGIGSDFRSRDATGGTVSEESIGHLGTSALFHNRLTVLHAKRSGAPCTQSPLSISFCVVEKSKRKF